MVTHFVTHAHTLCTSQDDPSNFLSQDADQFKDIFAQFTTVQEIKIFSLFQAFRWRERA